MLKKLSSEEKEQYLDFAYSLTQNLSQTAFPLYCDRVKTKDQFVQAVRNGYTRQDEEVLLFMRDGTATGWLHYYWDEQDKALGLLSFSVQHAFGEALAEVLDYWREHFPGYSWHFYFPEENTQALAFMKSRGYPLISRETVDVLLFSEYIRQEESPRITPVTQKNFALFRRLHTQSESEMYWTSDRIEQDLANWNIFICTQKESCLGALYYRSYSGGNLEIFGIDQPADLPPDEAAAAIIELLQSALNQAQQDNARSMYFFTDPITHPAAEKLGFRRVTAACYFEGSFT